MVQPHLGKIFENINKIQFDDAKQILSMSGTYGEIVDFRDHINPTTKNVEYWMGSVEKEMKNAIQFELMRSVKDYPKMERVEWTLCHIG